MASHAANPLTPDEIARIGALHAAGKTRNDIAKDLGRSGATITAHCRKVGLSFNRAATAAATQAKKADAAALRAQLELDYLADAQKLRQQLWQPHEYFDWGGKDHDFDTHTVDEPSPVDKLKLMQASTGASAAALRIDAARADGGDEAAKSLILGIAGKLGLLPADNDNAP